MKNECRLLCKRFVRHLLSVSLYGGFLSLPSCIIEDAGCFNYDDGAWKEEWADRIEWFNYLVPFGEIWKKITNCSSIMVYGQGDKLLNITATFIDSNRKTRITT